MKVVSEKGHIYNYKGVNYEYVYNNCLKHYLFDKSKNEYISIDYETFKNECYPIINEIKNFKNFSSDYLSKKLENVSNKISLDIELRKNEDKKIKQNIKSNAVFYYIDINYNKRELNFDGFLKEITTHKLKSLNKKEIVELNKIGLELYKIIKLGDKIFYSDIFCENRKLVIELIKETIN
jgi:hypothetical protein